MIHPARIHRLNDRPVRSSGGFVLYWMQQSQRVECNHALEYAVRRANALRCPVAVVAELPAASTTERTAAFVLQGLCEMSVRLRQRAIGAFFSVGHPVDCALRAAREAALVVCDRGYLRPAVEWRARVADEALCSVVEVESDAIVPVDAASDHAEYMARTLRPKLKKKYGEFLKPLRAVDVHVPWGTAPVALNALARDIPALDALALDRSVGAVRRFRGGTAEAKRRLQLFIERRLAQYAAHSNQPQTDDVSELSPYLRFGQISPLYVAAQILDADADAAAKEAFIEQLLVRRELAINFVWFTPDYDGLDCLPNWARQTLALHAQDAREVLYSREQLAASRTHDPYWNAAMSEMRATGYMHNYMRMYWGKKVLEWSASPEEAFSTLLEFNNRYFLDGFDPNSYAGVAWVFGKHDTAWAERPIFGKTRYMNAAGLRRKCAIDAYVAKVEARR